MLLKAGTYRWNDDVNIELSFNHLSMPDDFEIPFVSNGEAFTTITRAATNQIGRGSVSYVKADGTRVQAYWDTTVIDWTNGTRGWYPEYQSVTFPDDIEADDTFGTWYIASTDYNKVNAPIEDKEYIEKASWYTSVANAIRSKKGTTEPINRDDFASEISAISVGSNLPEYDGTVDIVRANSVLGWRRLNDYCVPFHALMDDEFSAEDLLEQYHFVVNYDGTTIKMSPMYSVIDGDETITIFLLDVGAGVGIYPLGLITELFLNEILFPVTSCPNSQVEKWLYDNTSPSAGMVYDESLIGMWTFDESAISKYSTEVDIGQGVMMFFQCDGHQYTSMRLVENNLIYYRGDNEYVVAGDITNGFDEKYRTIIVGDSTIGDTMSVNGYAWLKNNAVQWDKPMVDEAILGTWILADGVSASSFGIHNLLCEYEAPIAFVCDGTSYNRMIFGDSDLGGITIKYEGGNGTTYAHDGRDWYDDKYKTITITGGYAPPTFKDWLLNNCEKVVSE